jgi:uncharacterized membrane protein YdjX (TVP38/TMEM64 family)
MSLIGFTYGMWPGVLISSLSSMVGAAIAFLSVRRFFLGWVKKRSNAKWDAFGRVMKEKGLPLVIMIRWCPLPWALSNGLFAVSCFEISSMCREELTCKSVESVQFWQYMLATL